MRNNVKIALIGGDRRQTVIGEKLADDGAEVAIYGLEQYEKPLEFGTKCSTVWDAVNLAKAVILPLPWSVDGININAPLHHGKIPGAELFAMLTDSQIVCGGMMEEDKENFHDYYKLEELQILNAIPTAEGAIAVAMEELPITLHGCEALVIGYGRIGKALSERLKGLGVRVTVAARKERDLAYCISSSYNTVHIGQLAKALRTADVVFNTVPSLILDKRGLRSIGKNTVIIDLAGKPGGVDFDEGERLGLNIKWALALPGKVSPVTAGEIIHRCISGILRKEGVLS